MVGILAFADMEVLDHAGPYEVFNVAGELGDEVSFEVVSLGLRPGPVAGRGGFTVVPDVQIDDAPRLTDLVVPGGAGTRPLLQDRRLVEWVRATAETAELVASVCTGALLLAASGLLQGRPATTHHGAFDELAALSPSTTVVRDRRFVQSAEKVWTSAGVSAGIDLSLHLVGLVAGDAVRRDVAAEMEWRW